MPSLASTSSLLPSTATLSHVPLDWIILGVFALVVTFDALRSGTARATTLALTLPLTTLLFNELPQTYLIGPAVKSYSTTTAQSILFVVLFAILYFFIYRMTAWYGPTGGFFGALISGLAATIVTVVMWLQEPALGNLWHFSAQINSIFGASYAILWLLVAYLGLAFARG